MGKMFRVIPLVVIPCLLFSLIESLNILPAHLSHIPKRVRQGPLAPLEAALRWRYLTASIGVGTEARMTKIGLYSHFAERFSSIKRPEAREFFDEL